MTRWTLPVGLGLALGLVALVAVIGITAEASRTPAERSAALAAELRCPDCQGLSVADSPTRSAREIRRQIDELVASGASNEEVVAHFTARYGEWIRLAPSNSAVWIVPFAAVVVGVVALAAWIGRRRAAETVPERSGDPSEEERRRVHDEAEALDA